MRPVPKKHASNLKHTIKDKTDQPRHTFCAIRPKEALILEKQSKPMHQRFPALGAPLPLTATQHGLWLIQRTYQSNWAYNVPFAAEISGPIDTELLENAFQKLIANHSHLNSRVTVPDGVPHLAPVSKIDAVLHCEKISSGSPSNAIFDKALCTPFSLESAPLIRCHFFSTTAKSHFLLLVVHHIVCDGLSIFLLYKELITIYDALVRHRSVDSHNGQQPFWDFMSKAPAMLSGERGKQLRQFWQARFSQGVPAINFPVDHPGTHAGAIKDRTGRTAHFAISKRLQRHVGTLGSYLGISLSPIFLAAFKILIHKYTAQNELITCMPISGRRCRQSEKAIGYFANTVAIREKVMGDMTAEALILNLKNTISSSVTHGAYPFPLLIRDLRRIHGKEVGNAFGIAFVFHNYFKRQNFPLKRQRYQHHWQEVCFKPRYDIRQSGEFDLTLEVIALGNKTSVCLKYDQDLFEAQTMNRLFRHYKMILNTITSNPAIPVAEIDLLSDDETDTLLYKWNHTQSAFSRDTLIHQLFERQAHRCPQQTALTNGSDQLSYRQLNAQANQLAHFLRYQGLKPGEPVAITISRCFEMVAGVLGILKAGGIYVPLEPFLPDARILHVIRDMGISWVATDHKIAPRLVSIAKEAPGIKVICCLDRDMDGPLKESRKNSVSLHGPGTLRHFPVWDPSPVSKAGDLAYVIFTSGSTGLPKGVMVQHRPVINLIEWVNGTFQVNPEDKLLFITSLGFDLSVYDIFGTLAAGGTIRIANEMEIRDPEKLKDIIEHEQITFWDSAPAALQNVLPLLCEIEPDPSSSKMRLFFLSGDYIPVPMPDKLRKAFPGAQVISLGGATEATIWSNHYTIRQVNPAWPTIPYGKPIQNARYYVLNEQLKPCPIGVPGDLYIGGECLAAGYINDPRLTERKFIADPFQPHGRIYHTGDLARWRGDGNLEFLGRRDSQVKIKGYRIELGEIENTLRECAAVTDALVTVYSGAGRQKNLCGYFTAEGPIDIDNVKTQLRKSLPEYMMPASLLQIDQIPVSANGKIDRKALPDPRPGIHCSGSPPKTPGARALSEIWQSILELETLPDEAANFFDLGGDSLLIARLTSEINRRFHTHLSFAEVFQLPVLGELSRAISNKGIIDPTSPLVCMKTGRQNYPPFFCVHPGGGDISVFSVLARSLPSEIWFYGLRAIGSEPFNNTYKTPHKMAENYLNAILSVQPQGPYRLGGFCTGGTIAWEIATRLSTLGHRVEKLILIESLAPTEYPPIQENADIYFDFLRDFGELTLFEPYRRLHRLAPSDSIRNHLTAFSRVELIQSVFECARMTGQLSKDFETGFVEAIFQVYETTYRELSRFSPAPYTGPVLLIKAQTSFEACHLKEAAHVGGIHLELMNKFNRLSDLGWGRHCSRLPEIRPLAGNHFSILKKPQVHHLAEILESALPCPAMRRSASVKSLEVVSKQHGIQTTKHCITSSNNV